MATINELEKDVQEIKERNRRVEDDKAWETSYARRALLTAFTYLSVGAYLQVIGLQQPWLNAIIPAIAFMLSTLTLPFFKNLWLNRRHKK